MKKRKLGDRINRGFVAIVLVLSAVMLIRAAFAIIQPEEKIVSYPETQDDFAETANGLGISVEMVDSSINAVYTSPEGRGILIPDFDPNYVPTEEDNLATKQWIDQMLREQMHRNKE